MRWQQRARPGDERGDVELAGVGRAFELEVVDVPAEAAVAVAQLVVEELQPGVEDTSGHPAPPLVMMSSGIVTMETTTRMTR